MVNDDEDLLSPSTSWTDFRSIRHRGKFRGHAAVLRHPLPGDRHYLVVEKRADVAYAALPSFRVIIAGRSSSQPLLFPYFRSTSVSGAEAFIYSAQIVTCPLPKAPQMGKSFSRLAMTQFIGHIQGGVAPIRCSSLSIFLDDSGVPRLDRNRLLWPCRHLSQQIRSRTVGVSETFWVAGIVEVVVEPLALSVHPVFHPDSCR